MSEGRTAEALEVWGSDIRSTSREGNTRCRGHRRRGPGVDGLGPGENGIGTVHRRCRGTECIVYRSAFLFGGRWKREERELGSSINFEDDG